MKQVVQVALASLVYGHLLAQAPIPKKGFVPDEKTAIRIAEAVLSPIYGEAQIDHEHPFVAKLTAGVWTVQGTLAPDLVGGTALVRIDKRTGAILSYIHGK